MCIPSLACKVARAVALAMGVGDEYLEPSAAADNVSKPSRK
jgi:hypothetical protein